jgi:cytochrome c peroxidase
LDLINTRAPSLRDVVGHNGVSNGQLMHDGSLTSLAAVIDHYNLITPNQANNNLDNRLRGGGGPGGGQGQSLNLTQTEKDNLVAFLQTLSGTDVYTNQKWSDPF